MSLEYKPASGPLHISVQQLSLNEGCTVQYSSQLENSPSDPSWRTSDVNVHRGLRETVHLNDSGTHMIHCSGPQAESRAEIRAKRSTVPAKRDAGNRPTPEASRETAALSTPDLASLT